MKKIVFTFLLLTSIIAHSQSFEGTVIYKMDFEISEKLTKMGITKELLLEKMKSEGSWTDSMKVCYKEGDYYGLIGKKPKSWSFYNSKTNKIYSMTEGSDVCTVADASIDTEAAMGGEMPTVKKLDTTVVVNGITCDIVRIKWKNGTTDNYYNASKLIVDPKLYTKHIYEAWGEYLKISKALPVKIVKSVQGMTITMTLIAETEEPISDQLFTVPVLVADKDLNKIKIPNREMMRIKK